jgi:hypothetical protein
MGAACLADTGCGAGTVVCDPEGAPTCSTLGNAVAETCNGIDDNCDGRTDEGLAAPSCALQVGVCAGSKQTCGGAGGWLACSAASYPSSYQAVETACDLLDNDCDGQTDEGSVAGGSCSAGTGACQQAGTFACVAGTVTCNAVPGTPSPETCNGIDDDCNGTTDEGLTAPHCPNQTGVCAGSLRACGGAAGWLACSAASFGPNYEATETRCDGLDNDCDGVVDGGLPAPLCANQNGVCSGARMSCGGAAGWLACTATNYGPAYQPGSETRCNDLDDDCDGSTDEGCDMDRDGACTTAMTVVGTPAVCPAGGGDCDDNNAAVRPGVAEVCNGRDDDCDGSTDEGIPAGASCTTGTGACQRSGNLICSSGAFACSAVAGAPSVETCNGIDDDCNGTTDEGLTAPHCPNQTGVCAGSRQTCGGVAGWQACSATSYGANYQMAETTCDGLDNDCDGATDEGVGGPGCTVYYQDVDRDGAGNSGASACLCAPNATYSVAVGGDCNDNNSAIRPGAPELCANALDDDCNGLTDEAGCI